MGNQIICIGREFGSGGHEVAVRLSEILGIQVYEKHLLNLACEYGELAVRLMESSDEKATNPYLFQVVYEGNQRVPRGIPTTEVLFQLQSHEICRIAKKESCIFVGRCADYVLQDSDAVLLSVFIRAPKAQRIQRKMEQEDLNQRQAKRKVEKMDRQRRKYYEYYTGRIWGGDHYDMIFDSSRMTLEEIAEEIAVRYRQMEKGQKGI
ncbi:MAG: AAA family ATPase [Anaerovoracaceae bacterium]